MHPSRRLRATFSAATIAAPDLLSYQHAFDLA